MKAEGRAHYHRHRQEISAESPIGSGSDADPEYREKKNEANRAYNGRERTASIV